MTEEEKKRGEKKSTKVQENSEVHSLCFVLYSKFLASSVDFGWSSQKRPKKKKYETSQVTSKWTITPKRVRKYFEFLHIIVYWSVLAKKTNKLCLKNNLCLSSINSAANLLEN